MQSESINHDLAEQINKLANLHKAGALSDEEFTAFKAKLIFETGHQQKAVGPKEALKPSESVAGAKSSNHVPTGGSYSDLYVKDICRDEIIRKFVQDKKVAFYQKHFQQLIESAGIGNQKIADVDIPNPFLHPFRSNYGVSRLKRLPFTSNTQWNWSACFAFVFWGAWRGISNNWWVIAALCAAWAVIDIFEANGMADVHMRMLGNALATGVAISYGGYGNQLFLAKIVEELKSGKTRHEQTSTKDLWLAIAAIGMFSLFEVLFSL